jgi:hypothetical protein
MQLLILQFSLASCHFIPFGPNIYLSTLFSNTLSHVKINTYKTIILPVVLYGYETLSPTLREEHRLRLQENRVLRRVFELKRNKVKQG